MQLGICASGQRPGPARNTSVRRVAGPLSRCSRAYGPLESRRPGSSRGAPLAAEPPSAEAGGGGGGGGRGPSDYGSSGGSGDSGDDGGDSGGGGFGGNPFYILFSFAAAALALFGLYQKRRGKLRRGADELSDVDRWGRCRRTSIFSTHSEAKITSPPPARPA